MPNKSSPHGAPVCEGAISSGTLRTQDLLRTFADTMLHHMPFNAQSLAFEARAAADALDASPEGQVAQMTANDVLQDAFAQLEDIAAREGMTFGTTEGDGACFGFWKLDDDGEA